MNFGVIGLICLASALIAFFSGRFSWGFLAPFIGAALFLLSDKPTEHYGFALGVLAMAAVPLGIIALVGASIGFALSPWKKSSKKNEISTP